MKREIKFRAWDGNRMAYQGEDGWFSTNLDTTKYKNQCLQLPSAIKDEKITVMQYTGLKDKNGKEIYEGDIMGGYPHGEAAVRWNNEYACFECYWTEEDFDEEGEPIEKETSSLFANELLNCKDKWVVIGNIYEPQNS